MGAHPGYGRPAAARIIANAARTASHWTPRTFPQAFSPGDPTRGMKFAAAEATGCRRMPIKCQMNTMNIWLY